MKLPGSMNEKNPSRMNFILQSDFVLDMLLLCCHHWATGDMMPRQCHGRQLQLQSRPAGWLGAKWVQLYH
jgi:hypothetical protein